MHKYIWNYWLLSEITSDEVTIVPYREFENGFNLLNIHDFQTDSDVINDFWQNTYNSINDCNTALYQLSLFESFEKLKSTQSAEIRFLRAFYHYLLLDTFGNVPIIDSSNIYFNNAKQFKREEVFNFCVTELNAILKDLPENTEYGRVNKGVCNALLCKLYLNAKVYANQNKWEECILYANSILRSNKYKLEANYYDNFKLNNETSKENIFPIGFSSKIELDFPNMNHYMLRLSYQQLPVAPWNIFSSIAEFYVSFGDNDIRKKEIWEGQQFSNIGWPAKGKTGYPLLDRSGDSLIFDKETDTKNIKSYEGLGVRVVKYQPDVDAPAGQAENDFVIFRLSDIILSKAEALFRIGKIAESLELINQIRNRAGLDNITELSSNAIYEERGRELYWEGFRRQDAIRFNKFLEPYTSKKFKSEDFKILFPIPAIAININPSLIQNKGY